MTDSKQTEAARLANQLDYHREYDLGVTHTGIDEQAAAELRRQQAEIERLNEALAQQPAQRKPLTDEEIERCMKQAYATVQGRNLELAFARAIEAAHGIYAPTELKEKNT